MRQTSYSEPLFPVLATDNSEMDREPCVGEAAGLHCEISSFQGNLTCLPVVPAQGQGRSKRQCFRHSSGCHEGWDVSSWNLLVPGLNFITFSSSHPSAEVQSFCPEKTYPPLLSYRVHCFLSLTQFYVCQQQASIHNTVKANSSLGAPPNPQHVFLHMVLEISLQFH